ncbi:MAG: 50S ribosomal protein L22 [Candidatus Micrarchaeota archaeon]|nr:50S ribosomal protein L22 [Candidatus Micrarchaeota archaeon]
MYSYKSKRQHAKARLEDINASFKDLCAVCDNVRNMRVQDAILFLSLAKDMRIPVYYRRWNKKLGARKELKGKKGRYPEKAARLVLKLLKSAVANAEQKNLDVENLYIAHIAANKKNIYPRLAPKGRRIIQNLETARVELVLEELSLVQDNKKEESKPNRKKKENTNQEISGNQIDMKEENNSSSKNDKM